MLFLSSDGFRRFQKFHGAHLVCHLDNAAKFFRQRCVVTDESLREGSELPAKTFQGLLKFFRKRSIEI